MSKEKIYPQGLRTFAKNEKAPDFVLGTLVITPNELIKWLPSIYCKINTFISV